MVKYVVLLAFVLSAAMVASGILLSSRLRSEHKRSCFASLIYYETFYFTYGFYAIWGQVILVSFLSAWMTEELLGKTSTFLTLLGTPFIIFTWMMLLRFTLELSGREIRGRFTLMYLLSFALLFAGVYYFLPLLSVTDPFAQLKYGFIVFNFMYYLTSVILLLSGPGNKAILRKKAMRQIAAGLLVNMLIQNFLLFLYEGNVYVAMAFTLVYFIGGAFIPVYMRYKAGLSMPASVPGPGLTLDILCKNFDISAREKDIIREICLGLSNQQIADKLFISLQTVKDHTSRIYAKINCSSRAQLITMVKDLD